MTSPCPVLAGYSLVRSRPCACLSSTYVQNLLAAYAFAMVGLHSLPFVFLLFFGSPLLYGLPYLGTGPCLTVSFAFLQPTLFPATLSCHTTLSFLLRSHLPQSCWASLGLLFILLLMAQYGHWFFYYITGELLCPICFPLGFLSPFLNFAFPLAFTKFFGLPWPNYIISHPWGSWACYQPLTFFAFITLGLSWPILAFPHHILPMVFAFSLFLSSFKPIYLLMARLFTSWACDPLFLPLGLNGFSIYLPTLFCPCCRASPSHLGFQNGHQHPLFCREREKPLF